MNRKIRGREENGKRPEIINYYRWCGIRNDLGFNDTDIISVT